MSFDRLVLNRGFWVYVWQITSPEKKVHYVGRTGDRSSLHASSPFFRIGQHLDTRANAKGNSLAKRLRQAGIIPPLCKFEMLAFGPFSPEVSERTTRYSFRDRAAAIEAHFAAVLIERSYGVVGTHHSEQELKPGERALADEFLSVYFPGHDVTKGT